MLKLTIAGFMALTFIVFTAAISQGLSTSSHSVNVPETEKFSSTVNVVFENKAWRGGVEIEVRYGRNTKPERNRLLSQANVRKGNTVEFNVESGGSIYWRRERDPHNPKSPPDWYYWHHKPIYGSDKSVKIEIR